MGVIDAIKSVIGKTLLQLRTVRVIAVVVSKNSDLWRDV